LTFFSVFHFLLAFPVPLCFPSAFAFAFALPFLHFAFAFPFGDLLLSAPLMSSSEELSSLLSSFAVLPSLLVSFFQG